MKPIGKVLVINYEETGTGCRLCELVCAVMHDGISNPSRSRIKVMKWESEGLYIPMSCQQCQDAPCMNVCPVKAISRDENLGLREDRLRYMHRVPRLCIRLSIRRHEF